MSSTPASKVRLLMTLRVFCLALIGLHLLASSLPEAAAWGLWPFTYLPVPWRWILAGLAALTCWPGLSRMTHDALRITNYASRITNHIHFLIPALLALIPFSLFRIVHTRWGDAYLLIHGIAYHDPALRLTATWQAPLDVWLHARLWLLGNQLFGWSDAWPAYRLLRPRAGAACVYALRRLRRCRARPR